MNKVVKDLQVKCTKPPDYNDSPKCNNETWRVLNKNLLPSETSFSFFRKKSRYKSYPPG